MNLELKVTLQENQLSLWTNKWRIYLGIVTNLVVHSIDLSTIFGAHDMRVIIGPIDHGAQHFLSGIQTLIGLIMKLKRICILPFYT